MIVGIGVDCTSVSRLAASIQRPHFVQRVFGQAEQALLQSRGGRAAETAAANFAAKEAFLKAVGLPWPISRRCGGRAVRRSISFPARRRSIWPPGGCRPISPSPTRGTWPRLSACWKNHKSLLPLTVIS